MANRLVNYPQSEKYVNLMLLYSMAGIYNCGMYYV